MDLKLPDHIFLIVDTKIFILQGIWNGHSTILATCLGFNYLGNFPPIYGRGITGFPAFQENQ